MVKRTNTHVALIDDDEIDDIDTGSRYDPDAPILLDSCYQCRPDVWVAGKPSSGEYRCKFCGQNVPLTCFKVPS